MRITACQVYGYRIPLRTPLGIPGGELSSREGLLLRVELAHTVSGWGDVAPLPGWSGESLEECKKALLSVAAFLTGRELHGDYILDGSCEVDCQAFPPSVQFGIECACLDSLSKLSRIPLRSILAEEPADAVTWNGLVDPVQPDALEDVSSMLARGYQTLKIKVGRQDIEKDQLFLEEIVGRSSGALRLRLDANRAWTMKEASLAWERFSGLPIEYVEEPLAMPGELLSWVRSTGAPVALDETVRNVGCDALAEWAGVYAVVLKPTFIGGLTKTLRWIRSAQSCKIRPVISAAFESGVGVRALAQLAACTGNSSIAAGLDPYRWLAADVVEPELAMTGDTLDLVQEDRTVVWIDRAKLVEYSDG